MNRQGPGKIDWTDYTWNPVTGCWGPGGSPEAPHYCPYCYAKRMYERFGMSFEPRFYPQRLLHPGKITRPSKIFVCSAGELFGDWVPDDWVEQVMHVVRVNSQHTFQFLTKWPGRLARWNPWPHNAWVGATATDQASMEMALAELESVEAPVRFVSSEPLLGPIEADLRALEWLIIGAQAGPGAVRPKPEWITRLLDCADHAGVSPWVKDNVRWPKRIQYWPPGTAPVVRCTPTSMATTSGRSRGGSEHESVTV